MTRKKVGRKSYFINPNFQFKFVRYFAFCFLGAILSIIVCVNLFFYRLLEIGRDIHLQKGHVFFLFITEQRDQLNLLISIVGIIVLVLIIFGGIRLSHRVAGPLYRLTQDLSRMDRSNIRFIKFRDRDFFLELCEQFNEFVKRIK